MPEKYKDCCSRLFCMSVAEVNGEDFETMANKKDCRKRVFTNADRIRAMSDEELAEFLCGVFDEDECDGKYICGVTIAGYDQYKIDEWLKQPAE